MFLGSRVWGRSFTALPLQAAVEQNGRVVRKTFGETKRGKLNEN